MKMNRQIQRRVMRSGLVVLAANALLAACAGTPPGSDSCQNDAVLIDHHFEGGNFFACEFDASGQAIVHIRPEDAGSINPSPWYAFRVSPAVEEPVRIRVDFGDANARYWPKLSADGSAWRRATDNEARRAADDSAWLLELRPETPELWVSAQELLTTGWYDRWVRELDDNPALEVSLLGASRLGRPLFVAQSAPRREVVYLIGRQHPPEVTGALAMRAFVRTVTADTELARRFRDRYSLVIIPLINADGVARGHWRHNMDGTDLNRDWGPFAQPETRAARDLIASIDAEGRRPALMLDFHSTGSSLFYTQLPEESSWSTDFATEWFARFRARRPDFDFKHDARPRSDQPNTKNYFFDRYRIPAITYEIGDEEDREAVADTTPVFAEEMMRLLLETSEDDQLANRSNAVASQGRPQPLPVPD